MNIGAYLSQNARKYMNKLAVECDGRTYTYRELNEEVNRLAHGLIHMGVKKGNKIALMMKNSDHFVVSFFAAAKLGAVIVPINFRLTASEVHYILNQSESIMVFCDEEFEQVIDEAEKGTNVKNVIVIGAPKNSHFDPFEDVLVDNSGDPDIEIVETDDLEILYTSGTTGRPKGALFDHRRIYNVAISMFVNMGLGSKERFLHVAPLFHSAQLNLFLIPGTILGATHIIHRDFHPVKALQAIQEHQITHFFGVPAMFNFLLQVPNADYRLASIKRCGYGAAPMAPELVKQSMDLFKTDQFFNLCGLTEAGPGGIFLDPDGHKKHLGKGGKSMFLLEARVVNEEGFNVQPGVVGEFILRGETIMKEYYKKPEETKNTLKNGWLYTGDLATVDEEGYITLVDRKKDMIISGGENIYSIEVEAVLFEHPQVLDAAIIGLPDEVWGEAVCAVVVPRPGEVIDEQELKNFCRQKLAGYKIPRTIFLEAELPRNASGKILKYQLRQSLNPAKG
jgi:acyl-CoA synthetase (AMP-forming)/AMP-acid ligase II